MPAAIDELLADPTVGILRVYETDTDPGMLYVERADPRIWLSDKALYDLIAPPWNQYASLTADQRTVQGSIRIVGVLTVRGVNRTVVYRIHWDRRDEARYYTYAEWPD